VHIVVKTYLFNMGICSLCEVNARCFPCDACKKSFCKECADLTETEVRAIELKNRIMRFFCKNCDDAIALVPKLSDMISQLQGQVNQLVLNQQKASPIINKESIINELQDRQNRSKNVIVYNVPESRSSVINQRIVHDNDQIANVINDLGVSVNVYKVTHKVG
jgi:TolA-binding protein